MTSLYQVTQEGMELEAILTEAGGELTEDLEARLDSFLKSGEKKVTAACMVVQSLKAAEDACRNEAKRLQERAEMYNRNVRRLQDRILWAIDGAFGGKLKTPLFTVYGQTSGATKTYDVAPDADLVAMQKLFPQVVRVKYELDRLALKSMAAQGLILPTAVTVVENPGTRYLRIK